MRRIFSKVSSTHPLAGTFMRCFADAMLVFDPIDVRDLEFYLREHKNLSPQQIARISRKYKKRKLPQKVPAREPLMQHTQLVMDVFVSLDNPEDPLMTESLKAEFERQKCHILRGCLSDPEGMPMYRELRSNGFFKQLRCLRGTNALEGYHLHLRKFFGAIYASPQLLHTLLQEFIFRWNTRAGIKNLGEVDLGMFEHEIAEELHMLTQPYVGTGEGKLIPKTPLRSDDGAEYEPPKEDDGRHFGLRPMLDKLDNVAKIAGAALAPPAVPGIDSDEGSDDNEMLGSDDEDSSDNNVTDTALFSTTAHALTTQREHELLVKVVKQIQYPQGTSSQPRPIQWGSVFTKYNQEVARQVQFKPRLGVELHHASQWQLKQAYTRITDSINVTSQLKMCDGNLEAYKKLRRILRAGTTLPPVLPFFGPVRTVQQIIAVDRQNDMESWDYKLPKKASREVALKYRRLLDSRRFCSLCKKVCLKKEAGTKKWKVVGRHSVVPGARHDGAPKCDDKGRAPTAKERLAELYRVTTLKKKANRRIPERRKRKRKSKSRE